MYFRIQDTLFGEDERDEVKGTVSQTTFFFLYLSQPFPYVTSSELHNHPVKWAKVAFELI